MQHLTDVERRLLKCASVAGQRFTAWSVATMLGNDVAAIEEECTALAERHQFLKSSGTRTSPTSSRPPALSSGTRCTARCSIER